MSDHQDTISQLLEKLELLLDRQDQFSNEIDDLRIEIDRLTTLEGDQSSLIKQEDEDNLVPSIASALPKYKEGFGHKARQTKRTQKKGKFSGFKIKIPTKFKGDLEKFIGENLISKIGITITVIGVSIGAKYTIDHDLISPLVRIILGYLTGLILLGFGIKFKKKYKNYSAVLVGGAMAIMYFMTYAAYTFYDLIPQVIAFAIMVALTVFTTVVAISYNKQIIAHIGLVGAYAVPFLLSENPEGAHILFTYTAIINIGILFIALKKYWKPLYYTSFVLTWLMYLLWYLPEVESTQNFGLALTFVSIFFAIFYVAFLGYKLLQKETFKIDDILLLLINSFLFYGIGYTILGNHDIGVQLLGMFTIWNAIIHLIVGAIIHRRKLADKNLFYLVSGLVLVFITLAIPVQLDGNWVTLLWGGEAALLFWLGRTKNAPLYEYISYALIAMAGLSIMHDWTTVYDVYTLDKPDTRITPIVNINFLSSMFLLAAFGFINSLHLNKNYKPALASKKELAEIVSFLLPSIFLFTLYFALRMEIECYWNQQFTDSASTLQYSDRPGNYDFKYFRTLWVINYSLLFASILSFLNIRRIKNQQLGIINLALNTLIITIFLVQGITMIDALRLSFMEQPLTADNQRGIFDIGIRYISFAFIALILVACKKYIRQDFIKQNFNIAFDFLLHITILWIASNELINWMELAESSQSDKLGLSILWGAYSLLLIALGIWKKKKHLRIGAITLFGITLIKLFFYDISHLNTIAKTIVFVSLGLLLLIISFLYNKYKFVISSATDPVKATESSANDISD